MKKGLLLVALFTALFTICACQLQPQPEIAVCEVGAIDFFSEEEFLSAVKAAKEKPSDGDFVDLASVKYYYKPNMLPEGYVLYVISVSKHDIALYYLLEKDTVSKETGTEALGRVDYYVLLTYRDKPINALKQELGLDGYSRMIQLDSAKDGFAEMYHYNYDGGPEKVFWGNDKVSMMLEYPLSMAETKYTDSFYDQASAEYIEIP